MSSFLLLYFSFFLSFSIHWKASDSYDSVLLIDCRFFASLFVKMTTLTDLAVSAAINISSALIFLLAFALLRLQPINDRVYYPKWYIKGVREGEESRERGGGKKRRSLSAMVNLDWRVYLHFLDWTKEALKMPEQELIEHAGLDSVIYLRIYLLGWVCRSKSAFSFRPFPIFVWMF